MQVHSCPICGAKIVDEKGAVEDPCFPFCSKRCQLVDLGHWFSDEYVIRGNSQEGTQEREIESEEV